MPSLDVATRGVEMSTLRYLRARVVWLDAWATDHRVSTVSQAQDMIMRYNAQFPERTSRVELGRLARRTWDIAGGWADAQIAEPLDPDISAERFRYIQAIVREISTSLSRLPLYYVDNLLDEHVTTPRPAQTLANRADGLLDASSIARRAARRLSARLVTWTRAQATKTVYAAYGATAFKWTSQMDSKVRDLHREINGETFSIKEGHPSEGLPGEPYNCRCEMAPILLTGF